LQEAKQRELTELTELLELLKRVPMLTPRSSHSKQCPTKPEQTPQRSSMAQSPSTNWFHPLQVTQRPAVHPQPARPQDQLQYWHLTSSALR
jgi:hypothetical protein